MSIDVQLRTLRVEPGDVIVAETEWALTKDEADQLKAQVAAVFPDHIVVVVSDVTLATRR